MQDVVNPERQGKRGLGRVCASKYVISPRESTIVLTCLHSVILKARFLQVSAEKTKLRAQRLERIQAADALFAQNLAESQERELILIAETERGMQEELEVKRLQLEEVRKMKEVRRKERIVQWWREYVQIIVENAIMVCCDFCCALRFVSMPCLRRLRAADRETGYPRHDRR